MEDATESQRPKGTILIELRNVGERLQVIIIDDGPGFPEDKLAKLIEPYVTTREKGTGLGLSIVQKIMEDHQGELHLSNVVPQGARVVLDFPIDSDKNVT